MLGTYEREPAWTLKPAFFSMLKVASCKLPFGNPKITDIRIDPVVQQTLVGKVIYNIGFPGVWQVPGRDFFERVKCRMRRLFTQFDKRFEVGCARKHIEQAGAGDAVAIGRQHDLKVPRQGGWVAGNIEQAGDAAGCE